MKTLIKRVMFALCMIVGITILLTSNSTEVYAFGGSYTFNGFEKEARAQIETYFDSNGNLIVEGYAFVKYVQKYTSKGYDEKKNTHSYRLKIQGTDKVYEDKLGADYSASYTRLGIDGGLNNGKVIAAKETYICKKEQQTNLPLDQVTFRFVIPKSDLETLVIPDGETECTYQLELEHNLYNIYYSKGNRTKQTISITKLADTSITTKKNTEKTISSSNGTTTISVGCTESFASVRVNASAVQLRNKNNDRVYSSYNNSFFTGRYQYEDQYNLHTINGQLVKTSDNSRLGASLVPLLCAWDVNKKTNTTTVADISLEELFKREPEAKTQYEYWSKVAADAEEKIANALSFAKIKKATVQNGVCVGECGGGYCGMYTADNNKTLYTTTKNIYGVKMHGVSVYAPTLSKREAYEKFMSFGGTCTKCLNIDNGYYDYILERKEAYRMLAEIEARCTNYKSTTTSTEVVRYNETYYCPAMYVEAAKNIDYKTTITVTRKTANITVEIYEKVQTQDSEEKNEDIKANKVNSFTIPNVNVADILSGKLQPVIVQATKYGIGDKEGYHLDEVTDSLGFGIKANDKRTNLLDVKGYMNKHSLSIKGKTPDLYKIKIYYTYTNDMPQGVANNN